MGNVCRELPEPRNEKQQHDGCDWCDPDKTWDVRSEAYGIWSQLPQDLQNQARGRRLVRQDEGRVPHRSINAAHLHKTHRLL